MINALLTSIEKMRKFNKVHSSCLLSPLTYFVHASLTLSLLLYSQESQKKKQEKRIIKDSHAHHFGAKKITNTKQTREEVYSRIILHRLV